MDHGRLTLNQALHVHQHNYSGSLWFLHKQQKFAADVRIASKDAADSPTEVLSFGAYDSTDAFQSHASLAAQPNGTLTVVSSDLNLQPTLGNAVVGSDAVPVSLTVHGSIILRPQAASSSATGKRRLLQSDAEVPAGPTSTPTPVAGTETYVPENQAVQDTYSSGLYIQGGNKSTEFVVNGGSEKVNSTIRLGSSDAANSMQWVSSPEALLLTRGNQTVMLFNSTHTIIFGADGVTSISLGRNATGSFVNIVTDAISRSSVAGRAVTPVLPGDIGLPSTGSGTHLLDPNLN
ncbi:hypothetical protein ABBQ32_005991 [Trebouxia sp. C0010 RCD-2024]